MAEIIDDTTTDNPSKARIRGEDRDIIIKSRKQTWDDGRVDISIEMPVIKLGAKRKAEKDKKDKNK